MRDGAARLAPFGRATRSFARLPAPLLVLAAILSFQFGTALAAELIGSRRLDLRPLLTRTYAAEEAVTAFEAAGDRRTAMKIHLAFG